uniref:Tyrosine-protein phosphatase domain-containing protein n=1 Tax=Macrostomum lignano TaxID=282301 RepID=A0A1I8F6N8_9PLAT
AGAGSARTTNQAASGEVQLRCPDQFEFLARGCRDAAIDRTSTGEVAFPPSPQPACNSRDRPRRCFHRSLAVGRDASRQQLRAIESAKNYEAALTWMCCVSTLMLALGIATLKHLSAEPSQPGPIEAAAFVKEHRRRTRNKELQLSSKSLCGEKQSSVWSRVWAEPDVAEGGGYMNASWIDGYNQPKKFIAAQGPLAATKNDFWRMVWQYRLLLHRHDYESQQCDKYWHNVYARFGDIDVWLDDLYSTAEYESRLFKSLKILRNRSPTPATGRAAPGTYICIDIEVSKAEDGRPIDILQQTLALRAKPGQAWWATSASTAFVYETVATALACRPTTVKVFDFAKLTARMAQRDPSGGSQATGFSAEFTCLAGLVEAGSASASARAGIGRRIDGKVETSWCS